MSDRLSKKIRQVFDGKEKVKHRVAAFNIVLEGLGTDGERFKFVTEHLDALLQLTVDSFEAPTTRLMNERDFRDRMEKALSKKDLPSDLFPFPLMLSNMLDFGSSAWFSMPQQSAILDGVKRMLVPNSHPILRREGLRLLLQWMRCGITDEIRLLFASCIELRHFNTDSDVHIGQPDFPICGAPLIEAPLSKLSQAEQLFDDLLSLITNDPNASLASLTLYYKELQRAYLALLYPDVFVEYKLIRHEGYGFRNGAPPRLQAILIKYMVQWLMRTPESTARVPEACFILEEMLLASPVDSEIIHMIIRQGLELPWEYASTIRELLALLRWWVFQPVNRRPIFLQQDLHKVIPAGTANVEEKLAEVYVDRYIRRISSLYDGRPSFGVEQGQAEVYREGLYFLRALAMEAFVPLTPKIWDNLITTLITIMETHYSSAANIITVPENAFSFCTLLTETLAGILFRSQSESKAHWEALARVLAPAANRWKPVIVEWARVVYLLDGLRKGEDQEVSRRHYRMASIEGLTESALRAPDLPPIRADTFGSWTQLTWTKEHALFLWRNWIRVIGNLSLLEAPDHHELAIRVIASLRHPDLMESLFEAVERADRAFEVSRCVAMACLAKIVLSQAEQVPQLHLDRFYSAIVNGLVDKDSQLCVVTLRTTSHIFAVNLPGVTVLVPAYIKAIASILHGHALPHRDVLVSVLRLATAMAILPDIYEETLGLPRIEAPLAGMSQVPMSNAGTMPMGEVRGQIEALLVLAHQHAQADKTQSSHLIATLITLLVNEHLAAPSADEELSRGYLDLVLGSLAASQKTSVLAAIDTLAPLDLAEADAIVGEKLWEALDDSLRSIDEPQSVLLLRSILNWIISKDLSIGRSALHLLIQAMEKGNEVGRAAELFVTHLLHHAQAYPADYDLAKASDRLSVAVGLDTVLQLGPHEGKVSVTSRNPHGVFNWQFEPVFTLDPTMTNANFVASKLDLSHAVPCDKLEPYKPIKSVTLPNKNSPPVYQEGIDLEQTDMLAEMLKYLNSEFPETVADTNISPERREATQSMAEQRKEIAALEAKLAAQYKKSEGHTKCLPPDFVQRSPDLSYLLLSHLGLLNRGQGRRWPIALLAKSKVSDRDIATLDSLGPRDQHKVALVYLPETIGELTEESILSNSGETSKSYQAFCQALGQYVPVDQYSGGLSLEEAQKALYYSNSTLQLVFHEPRLINVESRKHHISNDAVHVVWNESNKPYSPEAISGDFGNYQLVITPLQAMALYSVRIYADGRLTPDQQASIGPLFDGAIIPRALLAPLVRATVLAADRLLTIDSAPRLLHADNRLMAIAKMVEKVSLGQWSSAQILSYMVYPPHEAPESPSALQLPSPVVI